MGDFYHTSDGYDQPERDPVRPGSPAAETRPGVLVVDHDATVRSLLHSALHRSGFTVFLAADGAEALETYHRRRGMIGLVLLDLHLEGQDGLEVLSALKKMNPLVRCCLTASYLGRYLAQQLLGTGVLRIFMKPFLLGDVAKELRQLAGTQSPCGVLAASG